MTCTVLIQSESASSKSIHAVKLYTYKRVKHFVYMEGELEFLGKNSAVHHSMCECKSKFLGYLIRYINYSSRYIFLQLRPKLK